MIASPLSFGRSLLIACAGLVLAPGLRADPLPTFEPDRLEPFYAVYSVGNDLLTAGSATLTLSREEDHWKYELRTRPEGVFKLTGKGRIRETATFRLAADSPYGIEPIAYRYRQDDERRRRVDANFDAAANEMTWSHRGESGTESTEAGLLDRFSATLVIKNALASGFDDVEIDVFDGDRVKPLSFIVDGTESIETEIGRFDTIRVISRRSDNARRETATWFAPVLGYVPVLIEQRKRGDLVARMRIERYEGPRDDGN